LKEDLFMNCKIKTNMHKLITTFLCTIFLASCGAHDRRIYRSDSIQSRKIQKPYVINGERYEPLSSHEGFVQTGIASWYGADFHGKKNSTGEAYDMYAMTAAHKTLPFGVHVKVLNQQNGRETVVRINDRGPFVGGRIIDLSYSAARELGVLQNGTSKVRIEALGYLHNATKEKPVYAPANYDRGSYGIQVGSYGKIENAQRMAGELKQRYSYSAIREAMVNGSRYYRVSAGNYTSLKQAEQVRESSSDKLISSGFVVALD